MNFRQSFLKGIHGVHKKRELERKVQITDCIKYWTKFCVRKSEDEAKDSAKDEVP